MPGNVRYTESLRLGFVELAELHRKDWNPKEMVTVADALVRNLPGQWQSHYASAEVLCRAIPLADDETFIENATECAIDRLARAFELSDDRQRLVTAIQSNEVFDVLRDRSAFSDLLGRYPGVHLPATPNPLPDGKNDTLTKM